jgi:hypothetical protein
VSSQCPGRPRWARPVIVTPHPPLCSTPPLRLLAASAAAIASVSSEPSTLPYPTRDTHHSPTSGVRSARVPPSVRDTDSRRSGEAMAAATARAPAADKRYQPLRLLLRVPIPLLCFQWGSTCAPRPRGFRVYRLCRCCRWGFAAAAAPSRTPAVGVPGTAPKPSNMSAQRWQFFFVVNDHPLQMPFLVELGANFADVLLVLAEWGFLSATKFMCYKWTSL